MAGNEPNTPCANFRCAHCFVTLGWIAYTQLAFTQNPAPAKLTVNKVKDDLYEIVGDGGNVAVYITDEGVILIDDKFDQDHQGIVDAVKGVTNQPIKYIINTHYHADHSGGNTKFLPTAEIISTAMARTNILEHKQSNAPPGVSPARITFTTEAAVNLGGKEVRAHLLWARPHQWRRRDLFSGAARAAYGRFDGGDQSADRL